MAEWLWLKHTGTSCLLVLKLVLGTHQKSYNLDLEMGTGEFVGSIQLLLSSNKPLVSLSLVAMTSNRLSIRIGIVSDHTNFSRWIPNWLQARAMI